MIIEVSQKLQHWSCEFTTSSATEASWLPVLDCETTFHLDYGSPTRLSQRSYINMRCYFSATTLTGFLVLLVRYENTHLYVCLSVGKVTSVQWYTEGECRHDEPSGTLYNDKSTRHKCTMTTAHQDTDTDSSI